MALFLGESCRDERQPPAMTASSVRLSPLLSSQVIVTLSPGLPPWKRKCRKGLRDTEVPHCADSTVLPPWVTVTFRMKCAGMALPLASLRRPVSISWAISTFTSTLSPVMLARMRIGSAIFTPQLPFRSSRIRSSPPQRPCKAAVALRQHTHQCPETPPHPPPPPTTPPL